MPIASGNAAELAGRLWSEVPHGRWLNVLLGGVWTWRFVILAAAFSS
jgi:hypothetical protein